MSVVQTVKGLTNTYHAYVFGTALWYSLRAFMRIVDPALVASWFRPPAQSYRESLGVEPNDLELYTIRTDAWCLVALAMILIAVADAVPLPKSLMGSTLVNPAPPQYKKPYARALVAITVLHHVMTGIGSYGHWKLESHHNVAMDIGVYGNVAFTTLGLAALFWGLGDGEKGRKVA